MVTCDQILVVVVMGGMLKQHPIFLQITAAIQMGQQSE